MIENCNALFNAIFIFIYNLASASASGTGTRTAPRRERLGAPGSWEIVDGTEIIIL